MNVHTHDSQVVGEVESTLWSTVQQGPCEMLLSLKNVGVNTMNYRLQEYNGTGWVDLGVLGTDFNNTLTASQVKMFKVLSTYPQVQMVGYASGGALLEFVIVRYFNRPSGGMVPMVNF